MADDPIDGTIPPPDAWSVQKSAELYQIGGWGKPYFDINEAGHVCVTPDPRKEAGVDLYELTVQLGARGLDLPLLIRFPGILEDRIRLINECFKKAIDEYEFDGVYRGVFPIKVNQQRHLIEEVVESGRPYRYGLEAGSKPELLIALAAMDDEDGFIICNGYKDRGYIETALVAQRFDNTVVVVLERIEELDIVFRAFEDLGIRPTLGVRAKLSSKGMGRWSSSAGDKAKFGLTTAEMVEVVDRLAERDMLDCLRLLHFHIGSQVSSIVPVKNAMREAAQMYTELVKLGCKMGYIDVGGGLAVDYDGSRTDFRASMNYGVQEYAYDVVAAVQDACEKSGVAHPTIVSESGRAVAAYQSVLVFDALGVDQLGFGQPEPPPEGCHRVIREFYDTWQGIQPKNVQEAWHDAQTALEESRSLFKFGYLGLRELARAERLFWNCAEKIRACVPRLKQVPEELQQLDEFLGSIYYCNFSIFQSAPDIWAMEQLFPFIPIHRLDERPTVKARLADLTCDSDGIVDAFIDIEEVQAALDVHPVRAGERYLMAMFLGGAYQEILGDLHNLFGDTNAVHVRVEDYGYSVSNVIKGDAITDVLRYLQYDPEEMIERVRKQAERALNAGRMSLDQLRAFMAHYDRSLRGYTYLKGEPE
ncbi:MAG: biosynthetic arginine decarboxylase [Polyangiales bacterium]|nr:biosynthetic arginine decarboxylase [Myxococcales bacterium]MCB9657956.1 biosynthetic arginine decarboxylase [Sandaracinaceae bacterium]